MMQHEKKGVPGALEEVEERNIVLMEEVPLMDIDLLCSAVVMQTHKGKWGKLNGDGEEDHIMSDYPRPGQRVFRMWEGELANDCFDDRRIALQSICCPCYRFGKNMKRAGFGSCFLQGFVLLIIFAIALSNLLAFLITRRHYFLYLTSFFTISTGAYMGYSRIRIRKKFNIKDGDSFDDYLYHLICPCCALAQESRTLEINNVQDGIWHSRGDTICVGGILDDSEPPFVVSTQCPELLTMQKISDHSVHSFTSQKIDA